MNSVDCLPEAPHSIDASSMSDGLLKDILAKGLAEAKAGEGMEASHVFFQIRAELFGCADME